MKKSTMIILIVILISMIMLIPNQKVKAIRDLTINLDYSSINLNYYNPIFEKLDIIRDFLKDYDDEYDYFLTACQINYFNVILVPKNNNAYFYLRMGENSGDANVYFENNYYIRYSNDISKFNTTFEELKKAVINKNYSYISSSPSSAGAGAVFVSNSNFTGGSILYYTNSKAFWKSDWYLNLNNNILKPNDNIISYYDYINSNKTINISSNFTCDLNNKEMERVTIDFSDYQNNNYVYQYGIKRQINSDIVWYDIELSNGIYNFNEYYNNTIIYARVLDSENNEVALSEYKIDNSELPKFEMLITSNIACPVPNYDNDPLAELIQIDLTNCYNDDYIYQYSYDSKNYHTLNVNQGQMIYYLNEYLGLHIDFRIIDKNNNKIYFTYGNRTNENITDYDKDRGKVFYNEGISCDLEGNKIINITMDFSNITKFINEYNFNVVINGVSYGEIQYKEISLNRDNYQQFYDVKVYVDNIVVYSKKYTIGYLVDGTPIDGSHDESDFDNMYDKLQNSNIEDLELNVKDTKSMKELFISFLSAVSAFIVIFFDLLIYAFESLNIWLRACIICLFIIYIITRIVKVARRR